MRLRSDDSAMELPINIVVMVVVGLAALSALLLMLPKPSLQTFITVTGTDAEFTAPSGYKPQAALILKPTPGAAEAWVKVRILLADKEARPVRGATCLLQGLGTVLVASSPSAAGEYEFDGTAAGAAKMRIAGVTQGSLALTCDTVPAGYIKPDPKSVTVVVT